jgi:hypothetical protein
MDAAAAHKEAGAAAVARRDYAGALSHYLSALRALDKAGAAGSSDDAAAPPAPDEHDATTLLTLLAQLHSNASLCQLELGDAAAALTHGAAAVGYRPEWSKAHCRKAAALAALGRHREAAAAYVVAEALDPTTAAAVGRLRDAATRHADSVDRDGPIASLDHFEDAFRHTGDSRLRLATLAHAWNALSPPERYAVLRELLFLVGGAAAVDESLPEGARPLPHIAGFSREGLTPLPMGNYADVTVPPAWLAFFSSLPTVAAATPAEAAGGGARQPQLPPRVELLRRLWDGCNPTERSLIVDDMRSFYAGGGGGGSGSGDDADMADDTTAGGRPAAMPAASASAARGGAAVAGGGSNEFAAVTQLLERLAVGDAGGPTVTAGTSTAAPPAASGGAAAPAAHRPARRRES